MSYETKSADRIVEYKDKFKNVFFIEIRHGDNDSKEIAFTFDTDLEWGHPLEELKWKEFVEILKTVARGELADGTFNYRSDGDHQLNFRFVSRKDEYNAFKSNLLRFNSTCSHPAEHSDLPEVNYPCAVSFDIPLKIVGELIKSLEHSSSQVPNWQVENRV